MSLVLNFSYGITMVYSILEQLVSDFGVQFSCSLTIKMQNSLYPDDAINDAVSHYGFQSDSYWSTADISGCIKVRLCLGYFSYPV